MASTVFAADAALLFACAGVAELVVDEAGETTAVVAGVLGGSGLACCNWLVFAGSADDFAVAGSEMMVNIVAPLMPGPFARNPDVDDKG
jgi:hypothetical protein